MSIRSQDTYDLMRELRVALELALDIMIELERRQKEKSNAC